MCLGLQSSIPRALDLVAIQRRHEADISPLKVVLIQEVARYNVLLNKVRRSLADLQRGIRGLVVISPELELVFDSLFNGRVPESWLVAYPSVKPLAGWVRDLVARIEQLRKWADEYVFVQVV